MYYFIVNRLSGKNSSKDVWDKIRHTMDSYNVPFKSYKTEYAGHAGELAAQIEGFDDPNAKIIIVGGDGSLNEVLNGLKDASSVKLGVIPQGSGNDFARGLGIKGTTEDIVKEIIHNEKPTPVDLGKVTLDNGVVKYFGVSSGFGLDAIVCKKVDSGKLKKVLNFLHIGGLTYTLQTIFTLFSMKTFTAKITTEEKEFSVRHVIYSAQMNTFAEGGGVPMAPDADVNDGMLSICMAAEVSKIKTFFLLPLLLKAKHTKLKGFRLFNCKTMKAEFDRPVIVHTDGEYIGEVTSLSYEVLDGKLQILNKIVD